MCKNPLTGSGLPGGFHYAATTVYVDGMKTCRIAPSDSPRAMNHGLRSGDQFGERSCVL